MDKEYFLTREAALKDLKKRKKKVKKKLRSEGEKIIGDNSFVYSAELFGEVETHVTPSGTEWHSRGGLGKYVWYSCVSWMTQRLYDDLTNPESPIYVYRDVEAELEKAIANELKDPIDKNIINKLFKLKDENENNRN